MSRLRRSRLILLGCGGFNGVLSDLNGKGRLQRACKLLAYLQVVAWRINLCRCVCAFCGVDRARVAAEILEKELAKWLFCREEVPALQPRCTQRP